MGDADEPIVIDATPKRPISKRLLKRKKAPEQPTTEISRSSAGPWPTVGEGWKHFKSPRKEAEETRPEVDLATDDHAGKESHSTGDGEATSQFFESRPATAAKVAKVAKTAKTARPTTTKPVAVEPLQLEPAMSRRADWTPPTNKVPLILHSNSPGPEDGPCSQNRSAELFENLVGAYKCNDEARPEVVAMSDEASGFLKKRKRIELVPIEPAMEECPKALASPAKQKAAKKKARTITGLATAAYRPPSQAAAVVESEQQSSKVVDTDTGKRKGRKRASKASKKKPAPPKPILLSPESALRQVAGQEFLFGTSSQLARDQSPSQLRKFQTNSRQRNQLDCITLESPVNSDAIEPSEHRQSLWDAAARDADGDLFDAEMRNFADGSQRLPVPEDEDPFGYVQGTEEAIGLPHLPAEKDGRDDDSFANLSDILPTAQSKAVDVVDDGRADDSFVNLSDILRAAPSKAVCVVDDDSFAHLSDILSAAPSKAVRVVDDDRADDSFVNLSDILPATPSKAVDVVDDDSYFSVGNLAAGTLRYDGCANAVGERQRAHVPQEGEEEKLGAEAAAAAAEQAELEATTVLAGPRPSYEQLSDAQLAKQVARYGFKPIKKRTAMIALLQQCWQGAPRTTLGSRAASTSTANPAKRGAASAPAPAATTPEKRRRGRPRKTSASDGAAQEPPPSAQPTASPKRPRGRPKKEADAPWTPQRTLRCPKAAAVVMEIPDSEAESGSDGNSSPEAIFSPAAVDLALSVEDDTETSLATSPTDQQRILFSHIAKAVTTAPRTTDPANPSWHEKILLYDPIVLEDLTAWLNSGQLTRVGYDGEARVGEVKRWCESKSICCLWRVNLRGRERKRY
ncbi:hypothetical protein RJ55_04982 [Drechmeria coniospora]|nr:hypothetical protein RJ55_04982 [Drechmeria coniospora]